MLSVGRAVVLGGVLLGLLALPVMAADWPMWGGTPSRNMVAPDEKNLPTPTGGGGGDAAAPVEKGKGKAKAPTPGAEEPRGIKWQVKLGSNTASTPVVSGGCIFIGTNEWTMPGESRAVKLGGGAVLCIDEASGKVLWCLPTPRMRTKAPNFNFDHLGFGVASTGYIDGKYIYYTSNRDEILCLDTKGQADGNDGPYVNEGRYMAGWGELPNKPGRFDPAALTKLPPEVKVLPTDGDIIWVFNMLEQPLNVWSHDAACSSPLVVGDYVYSGTCNGVDASHKNHPSPNAPDLVCTDKKTGRLVAVNADPIGNGVFHGGWSSPALATVGGKNLVVYGGGDGFCYAYDAIPTPSTDPSKPGILKKVWWFDANLPGTRTPQDMYKGYHSGEGCSEIDGTPVICKNRVYTTVGQDPEHGRGHGCLSCFDITKTGDITQTGKIWQYAGIDRAMCTPAVVGDLVFASDHSGVLHCVNANTGKACWTQRLSDVTLSSPLVADGKVYVGDDAGNVTVMAASAEHKLLGVVKFGAPIHATVVAANGVLYVATRTTLFAWKGDGAAARRRPSQPSRPPSRPRRTADKSAG